MSNRWFARLGICLAISFISHSALAEANSAPLDPAQEQEALWVFGQVLSPFCPGKLLQDCPSSAASDLKTEIREKVRNGKSREDILADLYLVYGDELSAIPRTVGFGLLAWLAPVIFLVVGLMGAYLWLKSKFRQPKKSDENKAEKKLSDEERERIAALVGE
jgi:cytochrome c-type biogenesis protein CcmH